MAEGSRKKAKTYNFHPEWEEEFLFTLVKDKCVCLLCHQIQALCKRGNLERHHTTNHQKFKDGYPLKSTIRARKVDELKSGLKAQQSLFTKLASQNKAAAEASFRVSHLLAKHKKPFTDGDLVKEAMAITAETVFSDFKNKEEIKTALRSVPLGPATLTRRIESLSEDMDRQVLKDLTNCEYFSLQFDESLDIMDTAQLVVFVKMVFPGSTTKEDFLTLLHLKEKTRGLKDCPYLKTTGNHRLYAGNTTGKVHTTAAELSVNGTSGTFSAQETFKPSTSRWDNHLMR
ncbi:hypothetical protein ABVT39_017000 [Epinephelus coioides]